METVTEHFHGSLFSLLGILRTIAGYTKTCFHNVSPGPEVKIREGLKKQLKKKMAEMPILFRKCHKETPRQLKLRTQCESDAT